MNKNVEWVKRKEEERLEKIKRRRQEEKEWLLEHLKICGYEVEKITYMCPVKMGGSHEELYITRLRFHGKPLERFVFKHAECLSMISKNIQVKDMMVSGELAFPRNEGKEVELDEKQYPITEDGNEDNITPEMVLFYEDYVSLREHYFRGNHLLQVASWVRTDEPGVLDLGGYGKYKPTVLSERDDE